MPRSTPATARWGLAAHRGTWPRIPFPLGYPSGWMFSVRQAVHSTVTRRHTGEWSHAHADLFAVLAAASAELAADGEEASRGSIGRQSVLRRCRRVAPQQKLLVECRGVCLPIRHSVNVTVAYSDREINNHW
jgi:hypothetical protein